MKRRIFLLMGAGVVAKAWIPKLPFIDLGLGRTPISGGCFREGNPDGIDFGLGSAPSVGSYLVSNGSDFRDGETWEWLTPDCKRRGGSIKISKVDVAANTIWFEAV